MRPIIGFIGVGAMGSGMCSNLLKAEYQVNVFDANKALAEKMCEKGAILKDSAKAIGETSDIVVTVLPNGKIVNSVLFDEDGLADGMHSGQILLECSTVYVKEALELAKRLEEKGIVMLDCPVSGGPEGSEAGTLSIMVGGDESTYKQCLPIFEAMGKEIVYTGKNGNGQLTKLINQLLYDINTAALCEVLTFAVKLGLDPEKTGRIVNTGSGRSNASKYFLDDILNRNFKHGYAMESAYKDLINASLLSNNAQIPMPILGAATAIYQSALCMGYGNGSKASMIKVYEALNNVQFKAADK